MREKMKVILSVVLPAIIIGISEVLAYTYPVFEDFFMILVTFVSVIIPSSVAAYFSKKFLKNFEKNEKYVAALIFVHPKIKESFKFMFICTFIFGISWCISTTSYYVRLLNILGGFSVAFSTYLVLLSFIYFFKTLYDITKSE
jgi:hypothetical protein